MRMITVILQGVSRGIREAHLRGIVTSTTAMMNMATVEEALQQSRLTCPNLGIGVHLVLTTGRPVLPTSEVGSLVNSDGEFLGEEGLIERIHEIDLAQVSREWDSPGGKVYPNHGQESRSPGFSSSRYLLFTRVMRDPPAARAEI